MSRPLRSAVLLALLACCLGGPALGADGAKSSGNAVTRALRKVGLLKEDEPPPAAPPSARGVLLPPDILKAGPPQLYPDPVQTSGAADPAITQENIHRTICVPHYTRDFMRDVPDELSELTFQRYGIYSHRPGDYEVDHFISLEIGGSNDASNLWPQPQCPPKAKRTRPCVGAREKDVVENWLHRQVCDGKMTLHQAQVAIKTDWFAIYERIHHDDAADEPQSSEKARHRKRRSRRGNGPDYLR